MRFTKFVFMTLLVMIASLSFAQDVEVKSVWPPIYVDGMMDAAWDEIPGNSVVNVWDKAGAVDDESDLSGVWKAVHDSVNFYIIVKVTDDALMNDSDGFNEHDDSIEMAFDVDNGDEPALSEPNEEFDDFMLTLEYSPTGDAGIEGAKWSFATLEIDGIVAKCMDTDDGYIMEASIPLINLDLFPDDLIGFGVRINDDDDGDNRDGQVTWFINDDEGHGWNTMADLADVKMTAEEVVNSADIYKAGTAPVIDAEIDEIWMAVPGNAIRSAHTHSSLTIPDDLTDCSAYWKAMWDNDYFYFLVDVMDDAIMDDSDGVTDDDCPEIMFDTDNGDEDSPNAETDFMLKMGFSSSGDARLANIGCCGFGDLILDGIVAHCAETDYGYIVEASIPLDDIGILGGDVFGFGVRVNDDDDGEGRDSQVAWSFVTALHTWNKPADLQDVVLSDNTVTVGVEEKIKVVNEFKLTQNYPNPFNPTTTISYSIKKTGSVELKVYDLLGHEVASLVNKVQNPGVYNVTFDAQDLASGVYIYTMKSANTVMSNKMVLMK